MQWCRVQDYDHPSHFPSSNFSMAMFIIGNHSHTKKIGARAQYFLKAIVIATLKLRVVLSKEWSKTSTGLSVAGRFLSQSWAYGSRIVELSFLKELSGFGTQRAIQVPRCRVFARLSC